MTGSPLRRALAAVVAAAFAVAGCGSGARTPSTLLPSDLVREARPIGDAPRFHPGVRGPVVGPCRPAPGPRRAAHLEVFAASRALIVPAGIGVRQPVQYVDGRVHGASCYGSVVTLDPTGIVLARPGTRLRLSDLFRAWGEPLSRSRLAGFTGLVTAFVDGRRWTASPASVPLIDHAEIVLEVGPAVPPHASFAFPRGM
jgi:hypothetical protein